MPRASRILYPAAVAASAATLAVLTLNSASASIVATGAPAAAARIRVIAHFDISKLQQPDNIVLEPDGSAVVSLLFSGQVARVHPDGEVELLASFAAGTASGMVRTADGTLYVLHRGGSDPTGVYRIVPGSAPQLFAALPDVRVPNGLASDCNTLYLTDSSTGVIWKVADGKATEWLRAPILAPPTPDGFGANGIQVRGGAVWVAQSEKGLLVRIPVRPDGSAGAVETRATGLVGIDDFVFSGRGTEVIAALNPASEVVIVRPDGTHETFLTQQDGVFTPTSTAVRGNQVYVASADFVREQDPKLLVAKR
jgi:sugar lactone lactonase YvrE